MSYFDSIIIVFLVLVAIYLATSYKQIPLVDIYCLIIALFVLLVTYVIKSSTRTQEHFEESGASSASTTSAAASTPNPVQQVDFSLGVPFLLEEDLTIVSPNCKIYATAFHSKSYGGGGKEWTNVSFKEEDRQHCPDGSRAFLTFENSPSYTKATGFALSSNRIFGPYSSMLGIDIQTPFTIFITFKNNMFTESDDEIELLKLYGNSNNNNALSLFIAADSVQIANGVQRGDLRLMWVDENEENEHIECRLAPTDSSFVFNTSDISSIFIVRTSDTIRVVYMYGSADNTINVIGQKTLSETVATFSNKEMTINRLRNWKANIFSFGVVDYALSDSAISSIHKNAYLEYIKANNEEFQNMARSYNQMLEHLRRMKECPFDTNVCSKCTSITDWTNMAALITAPVECRQAISTFCSANQTHALCKCWNKNTPEYNTESCRAFRDVFDNVNLCAKTLTPDEIECIKKKNNLITSEECPKDDCKKCPLNNNKMITNTYEDPDYEKMRVNPDALKDVRSSRLYVDTPYPKVRIDSREKDDDSYDLDRLLVRNPDGSPSTSNDKKDTNDVSLVNMYKEDSKTNFDQNKNTAVKEYEKSNELASEKEDKKSLVQSLFSKLFPSS